MSETAFQHHGPLDPRNIVSRDTFTGTVAKVNARLPSSIHGCGWRSCGTLSTEAQGTSVGEPPVVLTLTASLMASVMATVWPASRSPVAGDAVTLVIVGDGGAVERHGLHGEVAVFCPAATV
jgi:hypothetical protein